MVYIFAETVEAVHIPYTAITIIFIFLATGIAAFIRRRSRDKCLKDFAQNMVTLEETSGKTIWGKLRVENTGLEFVYSTKHEDQQGHEETSYILYKYEYPNVAALIRYHDQLSERNKKAREKELKRTYHPTLLRRLQRKIANVFKTVRDSVMEVVNLLISQAKKATPAGAVLTSQDKYVSQMKQELMGSVGTSYEPLLERYIGNRVVLELIKGDNIIEYCGVLKEYTADFIEVMDVDFEAKEDEPAKKADLVVLRKYGVIRHLGE
jgi:small nuclear ribonucleoprotein (snRNP)-like protein